MPAFIVAAVMLVIFSIADADMPPRERYERIDAADCETVQCLEEAQVQRNREKMVEALEVDR